jgi:FtsP/CotA-like multicopper oxidase with cupredoxin domain
VLRLAAVAAVSALSISAYAAAPGITGTGTVATFNLTAQANYLTQPDGASIYSWGYGCRTTPAAAQFLPAMPATPTGLPVTPQCSLMQVPGPTLIVNQGAAVTVQLTNNLPASAGNTSIVFPGFNVTTTCPTPGPAVLSPRQGLLT